VIEKGWPLPMLCKVLRVSLLASFALATLPTSGTARAMKSFVDSRVLLDQAVKNINSVSTLVYSTHGTQVSTRLSLTFEVTGQEDEVHNREQDHESLTASGLRANGTHATVQYAVDVIFVSGKTYFRRSTDKGRWLVQSGMRYRDTYAGFGFSRGRTRLAYAPSTKLSFVGAAGGLTHLRVRVSVGQDQHNDDIYISGGIKPYVVRVDTSRIVTQNGIQVTEHSRTDYGPFNQVLVITPPAASAS
jgi:hypothetical protein